METLKKLQRLAKQTNQWFPFDIQDGCQYVGINPDVQKFMRFGTQGTLYQWDAFTCVRKAEACYEPRQRMEYVPKDAGLRRKVKRAEGPAVGAGTVH
ncbi:hypothetical protein CYMTET_47925 [Cymbomonas tetramitiformis]|uniref:Uncharacterized protein n=1 Tax=Cymbomonas tetramitiformis TaxID=36881 RepID=A0AAE0BUB6_9CHLO|nr:hypothetical protein CYMTET_47925 [Cymbomonas tetramitiformis]